jgi:hypothetical protein
MLAFPARAARLISRAFPIRFLRASSDWAGSWDEARMSARVSLAACFSFLVRSRLNPRRQAEQNILSLLSSTPPHDLSLRILRLWFERVLERVDPRCKGRHRRCGVVDAEMVEREWTRDEIVALIEEQAMARRGLGALALIQAYREGTLEEPGEVADLLALAYLLPDSDPLFVAA